MFFDKWYALSPRHRHTTRLVLLLTALLVTHAPMTVNDGLYGEDWLLFDIKPGYPVQTDFLVRGAGHPFLWLYSTLANLSGHPIGAMKLLTLAGIVIGAVNLLAFTRRLHVLSNFEACVFTFLVWSYAEFHNWATKLTATYVFSFALLCVGLNLFTILLSSEAQRPAVRIAGLLAIFCSFSLNSLIAAYGLGLFVAFLLLPRTAQLDNWTSRLSFSRLLRFADFVALPVVYWISTNALFPKIGPYTAYYRLRLPSLAELVGGLTNFGRFGFMRIPAETWIIARDAIWLIGIAFLISSSLVLLLGGSERSSKRPSGATSTLWPFLTAAGAFAAFASPYLASGISPVGHFYECRHLILFGVPFGLFTIGVWRAATSMLRKRLAGYTVTILIIALNVSALWSGYFLQQARWLRQQALIDGLQTAYAEPPAAVFNLEDGFLDATDHTFYGITELTGALHAAWDARPLFGFTGRHESPDLLQEIETALRTEGSAFRNISPRGPQATITLVPKPPVLSSARLTLSYYQCLISVCDRRDMIRGLADTSIRLGTISRLSPFP